MSVWIIDPIDPLVFGDGRPFTAIPGGVNRSRPLPPPTAVAGVVRAHQEAKKCGLHLILGCELALMGFKLVVLVRNLEGWGNLCEFISTARRSAAFHIGSLNRFFR